MTAFTPEIQKLVADMAETMYAAPGVGLAATQVDVHKRVIVIDVSEARDELHVFINPEIVAAEGEAEYEEGCLSVPGYYDKVNRAARITVRAQDERGKPFELAAEGHARRVHPARDGPPGRQGLRRLPVAAQARAARAGCARSSGSPARHAARARPAVTCASALPARPRSPRAALAAHCSTAGYDVPLVLTQPDRPQGRGLKPRASPVKALALERGLPVLQPATLKTAPAAPRSSRCRSMCWSSPPMG